MENSVKNRMAATRDLVKEFAIGVRQVIETQCGFAVSAERAVVDANERDVPVAIAAYIRFDSPVVAGNICVGFSETMFIKIMSAMLGETFVVISPDLADGACEITNMIYGVAKKKLNVMEYAIDREIPKLDPEAHIFHQSVSESSILMPFKHGSDLLWITTTLFRSTHSVRQQNVS